MEEDPVSVSGSEAEEVVVEKKDINESIDALRGRRFCE